MSKRKSKFEILSSHFPTLLLRLGVVLLFYFISRLLFFVFNIHTLLDEIGEPFSYWVRLFLGGFRFDLVATFVINSPFIIATLLPFTFRQNRIYRNITELFLFYIPNILAFAFNYIDIIYSRFTQKRMTYDVFRFVDAGDGFLELIPKFLYDFWYMFLIYLAMMVLFILMNRSIKVRYQKQSQSFCKFFLPNFLLLLLMTGVGIVAIRGGLQLRPVSIITVSKYAKPKHYSLVLNTPFTLIKTIDDETIERKQYFKKQELDKIYQPVSMFHHEEEFKINNVVIIILEGIGSYYSSLLHPELEHSFTPNLDSIAKEGFIIKTYANGTRSMEGIPAVLAGLPTLMNNEYVTSNYAENQISSLPILLKEKGYTSAFFHGGKNGTMNFDSFTGIAGFDYYYGKDEYNNDADYDGTWGIFDDKFLTFTAKQLDTIPQPFCASVFLLSSHHPYTLPSYYIHKKSHEQSTMSACVTYSDWALGIFFDQISTKSWFKNTLFVIVSDHATKTDDPYYNTLIGKYEIPMIFYHPQDTLPNIQKPFAQQIDILPSILDYLHYSESFFSFGRSVFGNDSSFAINYINGYYQLITNDYVVSFDGDNITAIYHRLEDPYLKNNILNKIPNPEKELNLLKAIIQTYNTSLIDNKLTLKQDNER